MAALNPWAHSRTEDQRDVPVGPQQEYNAYAVPPLSAGDAYQKEFGWAPHMPTRPSTTDVPSAQRLQTIPRYDYYVDPAKPDEEFRQDIDRDRESRYGVEDQNALGFTEKSGVRGTDQRWAPNPRLTPPETTRATSYQSPTTYAFTRLFDQFNRSNSQDGLVGSARSLNGTHFSMADHRRNYDILGMSPAVSRRNTYRIEPAPWDLDVVDLPPNNGSSTPLSRVQSYEVPATSRTYRLV